MVVLVFRFFKFIPAALGELTSLNFKCKLLAVSLALGKRTVELCVAVINDGKLLSNCSLPILPVKTEEKLEGDLAS